MARVDDLIEANKRGLLTGQIKLDFDQAVSSGLITLPQQSDQQVAAQSDQPVTEEVGVLDQVIGGLENAASIATGIVAEPLAGVAGIVQAVNPFADKGAGVEAIESVRSALTFNPRTKTGQQQQQAIGEAIAPVGEVISGAESFLGDSAFELTGSPAIAAAAKTLPSAVLELLGLKGAGRLAKVGDPSKRLIKKTLIESAPEIDLIKKTSRSVFRELDESGVAVKQSALKRLESNLDNLVKKEGIDPRVTVEAAGAIDKIKESIASGQSLPLSEMDTLRTVARNAIPIDNPNKARVGSAIVDEIDDFLDNIKSSDIEKGGQVSAQEVGKKYRAARKLWGRAKRAEILQDAIEMGSSRKAGVEKGIRNELNNLLNRKKSRKFLSKEDIIAIRKVTDGDFKQNFASLVGGMGLKFENSPSLFGSLISGGGVAAVASSIPGLAGAAAPIAIAAITVGTVSKEIAKRITKNRAQFLQKITGAGKDAEKITKAYLRAVPKKKRRISDLSDLLLDPDIDLSTLENIADETVQDAVKAAQFKRELLQASAVLSAGANGLGSEDG